jgi:hypothetical protein
MRALLAGLVLGLFVAAAGAEPVTTIRTGGSPANRVDIAILGDGYTAAEIQSGKYSADVETAVTGFFAQTPYSDYRNYFNVHRIDVVSNESGASRTTPTVVRKDTALGASFDCNGVQRLICVDNTKVNAVLTRSLPDFNMRDIVLVLVNDPAYGGSGGAIAVASTNTGVIELVLHETGHSFGQLADEYGGPPPPACNAAVEPPAANSTGQTVRGQIKWSAWIDAATAIPTTDTTNGIPGLFEGSSYCDTGLFRPTFSSKMRTVGQPWHAINTEQLVKRIYNFATPLDSVYPDAATVTVPREGQIFSAATPSPVGRNLTTTWRLNGNVVSTARQFLVGGANVPPGTHVLQLRVQDETPLVRSDPTGALIANQTWTVTVSPNGRADINGDGRPDLVYVNTATGQRVVWYLNGTAYTGAGDFGTLDPAWRFAGKGDFNGDGKPDMVLQNTVTGECFVWYLDGTRIIGSASIATLSTAWQIAVIGDFNGDGRPDLVFQNTTTGQRVVWFMNGATFAGTADFGTLDTAWRFVGTGDFNGDGRPDLVLENSQSGDRFIWFLNGTSIVGGQAIGSAPTAWRIATVGDFNGDGNPDIVLQNTTTGERVVWFMNGARFNGGANLPTVPATWTLVP